MYNLSDISPGQTVVVESIGVKDSMRRRIMDIGLVPGTVVRCIGKSPLGDPSAFLVRGAVIALRADDSKNIFVR